MIKIFVCLDQKTGYTASLEDESGKQLINIRQVLTREGGIFNLPIINVQLVSLHHHEDFSLFEDALRKAIQLHKERMKSAAKEPQCFYSWQEITDRL